jgi:sec-independent protein translocase protein TatB
LTLMFEVGFSELCLIGLVSLLVIGPERLPKMARLAGFWLGKTRSMVASVKEEIKLELHAEEMRQIFKEQDDYMATLVSPQAEATEARMHNDGTDEDGQALHIDGSLMTDSGDTATPHEAAVEKSSADEPK